MQNPQGAVSLPIWALVLQWILGPLLGGGLVALYAARIAKKKLPLELEEKRVGIQKTQIDGTVSLAHTLIDISEALRRANENIETMREKARDLEDRLEDYERIKAENQLYEYQLKLYRDEFGQLPDVKRLPPRLRQ